MIDWAAVGVGVAGIAVPLARAYAKHKVTQVIDAMAVGSHPKVPPTLQANLDAIVKERVEQALREAEAAKARLKASLTLPPPVKRPRGRR